MLLISPTLILGCWKLHAGGGERKLWRHTFYKISSPGIGNFFKICLRMKYAWKDHNHWKYLIWKSKWIKPHCKNFPQQQTRHKDLCACKIGHNVSWIPSIHVLMASNSKQRSQVLHHMSILGLKIEHDATRKCTSRLFFPFPVQNLGKTQQTAPPRTLLPSLPYSPIGDCTTRVQYSC